MRFGDKLRVLLEERNMTQKELAAQLNIAASTMGSYVQNAREPDFDTLKAIAAYFGVSTDYLLGNPTGKADSALENELLRIFRSLSPEQQEVCLEQCRVFVRLNQKSKAPQEKSS